MARRRNRPETWLFPDLKSVDDLLHDAPARLDPEEKQKWASDRSARNLGAHHEAITARLRPASAFAADFEDGELSFSIDGIPVVSRIFVSRSEGEFIVAQWKVLAATLTVTDRTDGRGIANKLRRLARTDNPALVEQIIALERELSALDAEIARQEAEMNRLVYRLYALSDADIALIESDNNVCGRSGKP